MLFDLRGRGRRHTVRVIYIGLALLMGVGLIGFGIGGGLGGGGLLSAASQNEASNKASFSNEIKKYRKLTQQQPKNYAAWEGLIKAQLHEAGGEAYVQNGQLTSKGRQLFTQVAASWSSYLALNPPKPSPELAQEMARIFSAEGLNQPASEVQVLQIVVAARPTSPALFASLAEYAYEAHDVSIGELAQEKAVTLAPAAQRVQLKGELTKLKEHPNGQSETTKTSESGQPFNVTTSANGKITATPAQTTSTSSSKTK
jgi:hypothetical protein